jgi:hypothetical protein
LREDAAGHVHSEGKIGSPRRELDAWIKTLPQPRMIAMEATIFTGRIYDHLLPHAEKVKVAHPLMLLMLRAIAASKKKHDRIWHRSIERRGHGQPHQLPPQGGHGNARGRASGRARIGFARS